MNTHRNTPRILEFSGHEGKRTSRTAWLLSGLLSLFAIGLSAQRRREQQRARRDAPLLLSDDEPAYTGADVGIAVFLVIGVVVVIGAGIMAIMIRLFQ